MSYTQPDRLAQAVALVLYEADLLDLKCSSMTENEYLGEAREVSKKLGNPNSPVHMYVDVIKVVFGFSFDFFDERLPLAAESIQWLVQNKRRWELG